MMDPNAALVEFRRLRAAALVHGGQAAKFEESGDFAAAAAEFQLRDECHEDAADVAANLDEWLSKGGYLPEAWERCRPVMRMDG